MERLTDTISLFAEDKLMHITSTTTIPALRPKWITSMIRRSSFLGRDMTHSFSNSQWLEMLERDWMFNKAAFDLLESHRQASTCPELKVAAAIYGYRNATIDLLSIGINGSLLDRSDPPLHIHKRSCIHAEDRALRQLPANSRHYHLVCYTSLAPCLGCAEDLYNAGIEAVSYITEYSEKAGKEFLLNKGKPVYKLKATGKMVPLNPDLCSLLFRPYAKINRMEVCT